MQTHIVRGFISSHGPLMQDKPFTRLCLTLVRLSSLKTRSTRREALKHRATEQRRQPDVTAEKGGYTPMKIKNWF